MSGRIWFTADTHFGHGGALGLFKRPFGSVREMDEGMIERWNARVAPGDLVWHLGDFGYRLAAGRVHELLQALNGTKRLVVGNNDDAAVVSAPEWDAVTSYVEIEHESQFLVLCHYPFRSWNRMHKGAWNLHGHSHGRLSPLARQADVGVDVWAFEPIPLERVLTGKRPQAATDSSSRARVPERKRNS